MLFKSLFILTVCFVGLAITDLTDTTNDYTTQFTTIQPNETNTTTITPTTPATTTTSNSPAVLNFTIESGNKTCLLLQFSIDMTIKYVETNKNKSSLTVSIPADYNRYEGVCADAFNSFRLYFWNNWTLDLNYTSSGDNYQLNTVLLNYYVNSTWFPNAAPEASGFHSAGLNNLNDFSTEKGKSYRCKAKTTLKLDDDVEFEITNYQGEAFYKQDTNKDAKFHTAIDCPADQTGTSRLVPIIVGSALAFLVVLVLIAYLIGRRKHRSGYQSV